jgi:hypothetical protein
LALSANNLSEWDKGPIGTKELAKDLSGNSSGNLSGNSWNPDQAAITERVSRGVLPVQRLKAREKAPIS